MNKVDRAVILAAGTGTRLNPITLDIPKPMVVVKGQRMIDTIIRGLHNNGINEIYIVVGYLKEKILSLKNEYSEIHFIENPDYCISNNISSLYYARNYLENSIILDGDQIIYNDNILYPYFEKSGYNAVWTDELTDEWLMQVDNGKIISCNKDGGKNGWKLYGISRWSKEDGQKLKEVLKIEYERKKNCQIYWDDIVMFRYFKEFDLGIIPMKEEDIKEIDSLDELIRIDNSYKMGGKYK